MKTLLISLLSLLAVSCSKPSDEPEPPYFNPVEGTWERYYTDHKGSCHQVEEFTDDFKNTSRIYIDGILNFENLFTYTITQTHIIFTRNDNKVFKYKYLIEDGGNVLRIYSTGSIEPGSIDDEIYTKKELFQN